MRRHVLFLIALIICSRVLAGPSASPPSLVVLIVVDQMRSDYLTRFADLTGEGGFARLRDHGATFTRCLYGHAWTSTGPGHSVVLSGIDPGRSGIVSNEWMEAGEEVYCVEDTSVRGVGVDPGEGAGRMSPRNFLGNTLGDVLKELSPGSKVVGVAIKDRGGILMAGKNADAAYWFDPRSGHWITSSYYMDTLPAWVAGFNRRNLPETFLGTTWTKLLPERAYERCAPDSCPGEGTIPNERSIVFPHQINAPTDQRARRYDAVLYSPSGNEMTAEFARAAVEGELLGQRGVTDILAVSFSSTDYAGHVFGPESHEILDMYVRLDRELSGLFAFLDRIVGMDRVLVVLTADHGVCPLPELHAAEGADRLDGSVFMQNVREGIGRLKGYDEATARIIRGGGAGFLYLDEDQIRDRGWSVPEYERALADVIRGQRGIARVYTRTELVASLAAGGSSDSLQRSVERSFHPDRAGGLAVITAPFTVFSGDRGTTHGSPYWYDKHVPLVVSGARVNHGFFSTACEPVDIAPTLAAILGIPPPAGGSGRVLREALLK